MGLKGEPGEKGDPGERGMKGPRGVKGEPVSYVHDDLKSQLTNFSMKNKFQNTYSVYLQGPVGMTGSPGETGPAGLPVSLIRYCTIYANNFQHPMLNRYLHVSFINSREQKDLQDLKENM